MDAEFSTIVPPPYPGGSVQPQISTPASGGLVSVDFIPGCTRPKGIWEAFISVEFEPFSTVIHQANEWLSRNPTLKLKGCETVEFKALPNGSVINAIDSIYMMSNGNQFVRGLRLWMEPRMDGSSAIQQIGYYNIVPNSAIFNVDRGLFVPTSRMVTADRLDTMVNQANAAFAADPIQGSILTVETVRMQIDPAVGSVDPDRTGWMEVGGRNDTFVLILRIYYEAGPAQREILGIADFVPAVLMEGSGLLGPPLLEAFPEVLAKAHQWVYSQPPHIRLVNVNTLLHKQKLTTTLDTLRTAYTDDLLSYFVKFLRIAYVINDPNTAVGSRSGPVKLNCKLFTPGLLQPPGCCLPSGEFESQIQMRERMSEWVRGTNANVISVETLPMRYVSGQERTEGMDTMHTSNAVLVRNGHATKAAENLLVVYRIFLDGVYPDPPGYAIVGSDIQEYVQANLHGACTIL